MGSHLAPKAKVQVNHGLTWTFLVALASFSANTPVALRPPAARLDDRRQSGRRRITARDRAQIVELYEQGKSTRYVADEVGVSKATVLTVLKRANVPMRPVGAHY
ncbi:helix-turn-helix domain-containing protein [Aestuariimicrobium ganziense]|uniref:helix-turn-helix domain-containing protein n=1 Tax=Aestuariimicrobium ganziense TaxID=2773677 RepID=UPI0019433A02